MCWKKKHFGKKRKKVNLCELFQCFVLSNVILLKKRIQLLSSIGVRWSGKVNCRGKNKIYSSLVKYFVKLIYYSRRLDYFHEFLSNQSQLWMWICGKARNSLSQIFFVKSTSRAFSLLRNAFTKKSFEGNIIANINSHTRHSTRFVFM